MIAHDIHDAVKESRKRARRRQKEAGRQVKKANKIDRITTPESETRFVAQVSPSFPPNQPRDGIPIGDKSNIGGAKAVSINCEPETGRRIGEEESQDAGIGIAKSKKKLTKIFTIIPGATSPRRTTATASPSDEEDPFRDPVPGPEGTKTKPKRTRRRWRGKATASLESLGSAQDPFRDPEPMRLVDADDFRLESPEDTKRPAKREGKKRKERTR
ncbi:hypothetical protein ANO14919_096520 [Xylariales sp. No.14919]|nr:hypothetical protein ANO14919_096520 [Xylariales sp. No.14919]